MAPEELARILRQRPFPPFRVHLTDGTTCEVRHPEQVLVDRRGTTHVGVTAIDASLPVVDRLESVATLHIVRLEPLSAPAATGDGEEGA